MTPPSDRSTPAHLVTYREGDRVAVHAPGYRDGDTGTVTGLQPGYHHCLEVDLDSGEGGVFAPEELEHIDE